MKKSYAIQVSTRLALETVQLLDEYAERTGESKASVIDAGIRMYIASKRSNPAALHAELTAAMMAQSAK